MSSKFEWSVAKRYLLPGDSDSFVFKIGAISLTAVMLGVAALIIVMSVINGFRAELFDKVVGLNGHAVIQGYGGRIDGWRDILSDVKAAPGVTSAQPLIEQPLLATFNGRVEGVLVRGMRLPEIASNRILKGKVVDGSFDDLSLEEDRIAIGSRLATSLGAHVGSRVTIINPQGRSTPFGTVPREISYEIVAIFEVGIYDYDKALIVMPIEQAQTLLLLDDVIGIIEVQTNNAYKVNEILAPLLPGLEGRAVITDWSMMNASLFDAIKADGIVMFIIVSIIVLVASFNILSSLIMLVRTKARDIAIMRTLGASRQSIIRIFVLIGTSIGAVGIGAGIILGLLFLHFRQSIVYFIEWISGQTLWDPEIRFLSQLPAQLDPVQIAQIVGLAFILSVVATFYPAYRASRIDPVQVLRYE